MGVWNNTAQVIGGTRLLLTLVALSVVLTFAVYQTRCTPGVVSSELLDTPVLEVRHAGDELYHLRVEPVDGDVVWVRWYTHRQPPAVGDSIQLNMTVLETGARNYLVIRDIIP
jgi:hypothetical protein